MRNKFRQTRVSVYQLQAVKARKIAHAQAVLLTVLPRLAGCKQMTKMTDTMTELLILSPLPTYRQKAGNPHKQ
jgi:hypothetical protein